MSAISPSSGGPKSMSTRLLTMKFMQRATASSSPSAHEHTPKRRKKELDSESPGQSFEALVDRDAVLKALAIEEEKRRAALERLALNSGDTRWVLDVKDQEHSVPSFSLRVVHTGYASLDGPPSQVDTATEEIDDKPATSGRRSFGRFNMVIERQQNPDLVESSESDSSEDDERSSESGNSGSEENDPLSQLIRETQREAVENARAERKSKKRAAKAELEKMAKKRRKGEVNLNKLTSLSGRQEVAPKSKIECYTCGGPHRKTDCPRRKRSQPYSDDGPKRKSTKFN